MIIVTGSNGAIGKAIVSAFQWRKVIELDLPEHDITDYVSIASYLSDVENIHALINCAGVSIPTNWDRTFEVNVKAPYFLSTLLKDKMTKRSSIINITSINAHLGFPDNPAYVASKHALLGLTKSLAVDYAPLGIRVNAVCPGYIKTDMTMKSYSNPDERLKRENRTLMGRYGEPKEVAEAVRYLTEATYLTGTEIVVDGGWMTRGL